MLEDATSQAPLPCDLIVLTDGHEHSSRRHPDELRRKIASSAAGVNIAVLLVGDTAGPAQATELAPKLGLAATAGWPRELRFGLLNRSPHKLRLCPFLTASVTLE